MKLGALLLFVLFSSTVARAETLIADYESVPGESLDSFVVRLAPELRKQTVERNAEVCGALGQEDGVYTLRLKTDEDKWECSVHASIGQWTGYIVHTHTAKGNEGWANADLGHPGYLVTPRRVLWQHDNRMKTLQN